ncbi:hypothetical protein B0J13DRAFT_507670 [Dactylonectria estremocensis]|uniref:Uncharacterized protein n=1 Tax=Dactylonectria estremocensis TaxID=1079267 RepID=A0A9P9E5Z5_9HYPO|nr:hypothetical protein B0J13DRAFT_507670 [Dactylonectria estremocensis]
MSYDSRGNGNQDSRYSPPTTEPLPRHNTPFYPEGITSPRANSGYNRFLDNPKHRFSHLPSTEQIRPVSDPDQEEPGPRETTFFKSFTTEPKKEVCSEGRLSALWNFVLLHLFPILITMVLFGLYLRKLKWQPTHPQLSALQFAAKAHESLIIVSLTDILLHRIRYGLLREKDGGIALGFLSSAFHLSSPIQYMISWEFWGTLFNPVKNRLFHAVTAGLVVLLISISIGASPFSAILMIPRLGWWEFSKEEMQVIEPRLFTTYIRNGLNETPYDMDLRSWKTPFFIAKAPILHNISMSSYGTMTYRRPLTLSITEYMRGASTIVATGPMNFATTELGWASGPVNGTNNFLIRSQPSSESGMLKWKQPLVAVSCNTTDTFPSLEDDTMTLKFFNSFHGNFSVDVDLATELQFLRDMSKSDNATFYQPDPILLDIQGQIPVPISSAILFMSNVTLSPQKPLFGVSVNTQLCITQARWADADVWMSAETQPATTTNLGIPTEDIPSYLKRTSTTDNVIRMHKSWLNGLGAPYTGANASRLNPAYRQAFDSCVYYTPSYPLACVPLFLGAYFTDALTYSVPSTQFLNSDPPINEPPGAEDLVIEHKFHQYQYIYDIQNGTSISVALAVLLLHVLIAILHTAVIILSPEPWHSSGWGSFGQLIALALRSSAPEEFNNVGGGVQSSGTWSRVIRVREVVDGKRLEMVVNPPSDGGSDGLDEHWKDRVTDHVRPKVKYS